MEDRYPVERWSEFQARVQAGCRALLEHSTQETVAVFTSATPIAIVAGAAFQLTSEKTLQLAWVMYNSGLTMMKLRNGALHLCTLNAAPHLLKEEWRTFR